MNELTPIPLANGNVTQADEVFSVSLDDVWHISYSRKCGAVKSLRKNFVQGVHYKVFRQLPNNPQGGRPITTFLLAKECAKKLLANKLRIPELRKAQRKTYFILCKEANAVKIGMALDASDRMAMLQCGNPFTLCLLLVIPLNVEAKLHRKFSALRLQNEWFSFDKAIADFIDECKTGALLSEII